MSKRWYAIQILSGFEKAVKNSLEEKLKDSTEDIKRLFGEILVPMEVTEAEKTGQKKLPEKKLSERKLYPGYVFIQMDMVDESWHFIRSIPKVSAKKPFVGGEASKPAPIGDKEMEIIFKHINDSKSNPTKKLVFEAGEAIRITDGAFKEFTGMVEEVIYDKKKLRVSVMIFGRATPVELGFSQVEKEI